LFEPAGELEGIVEQREAVGQCLDLEGVDRRVVARNDRDLPVPVTPAKTSLSKVGENVPICVKMYCD
jgi:hypothetical protein